MATGLLKRELRATRHFRPFQTIREEMEDLWTNVLSEREPWFGRAWMAPPLDVSENNSHVTVRMDLPGIKPEEIDIQLSGNVITISGDRKEEKEEKGETFHRIERRSGSFSRSVTLPCSVDESKVDAQYHDGVLTVTMPKSDEAKARRIKVKS